MKRALTIVAVIFAASAVCSQAWAQNSGTITGQVLSQATRQPLSSVQVIVVGTSRGTLTNQNGQYAITGLAAGSHTIRAILIGHREIDQTLTLAAGENARANFELRESAIELDAVVVNAVTGRAERKRELGTNSASISATDIARAPITKMADVLTARAPGVQLQAAGGTIGSSQRIRIRGASSISLSNEPLFVVDGMLVSNNKGGLGVGGQDYSRLNDINPDDIAHVDVLKGPAASALYGTAAANGVVLITTKRGLAGTAKWRAYAELGSSEDKNPYPTNYLTYQVQDASKPLFNARGNLNSAGYTYCPNIKAAAGTCSQESVLALNPFTTPQLTPFVKGQRNKYGLSVAGGGEAVTYYVSGDYDTEQGVISFNDQKKVNLRGNLDAIIGERLSLSVTSTYTTTNLFVNANDNSVFSPLINAVLATPFVFSDSAKALSTPGSRTGSGFGYFISDINETLVKQVVDRFIVGTTAKYRPFSWFSINANVGLDYFGRNDQLTVQPGRLPIAATYTPGFRNNQRGSNYIWTVNASGIATAPLTADLTSMTTVGGNFSRELFENTTCYGVGIVEGTRSCSATSSLFAVGETYSEVKTVGALVQEQLNWRDRLIVAASVRGDDNSAFGQDYGFIYYPGASVSWVASEESFFPKLETISNLRLRAAYGKSGQRPNFRDAVTLFEPVSATANNKELPAVRLNRIGNVKLKPERVTEFETGFDVGLLQDKLALEFTYFQKESQDALIQRPLPPSYGLTGDGASTGVIFDNLGSVNNWGTEIALSARVLNTRNASLSLRLAATTLDNRIEDLGENIQPIVFNRGNQQHKQGYPTGGFFARRYEIINPAQQRLLKVDDVRIVDDTAVYLGRSLANSTQVLSGDLKLFGHFTIAGLFERRAGLKQLNYTELFRCTTGYNRGAAGGAGGQCAGVADPKASVSEQARFIAQRFLNTAAGYIEDADFIKLRELSLTVDAPTAVARWTPMLRGSSITFAGRNLKTWTDYTGLDPEINETGGTANFTQGEFNTQPPLRYYTVRVNLAF